MQVASEQKAVLRAPPHFGILVGQEMHHSICLGLVAVMRGQQHLAKLIHKELAGNFLHAHAVVIAETLGQRKHDGHVAVEVVVAGENAHNHALMLGKRQLGADGEGLDRRVERAEVPGIYVQTVP